jgi:hypothetical protein
MAQADGNGEALIADLVDFQAQFVSEEMLHAQMLGRFISLVGFLVEDFGKLPALVGEHNNYYSPQVGTPNRSFQIERAELEWTPIIRISVSSLNKMIQNR